MKLFSFVYFVDFHGCWVDNNRNKFFIVNPPLKTFDDFVDDLLASDVDLLKGELDFLLFQHLFNSIDLKIIKTNENLDNDSLAA
ncbi:hypothetical protein [uncultured Prochlorococcus sp.]|uniref:hypothetical protein n=1 Tax=uncultured Prochlorococcus sp. TaxID=159733 RepID=UPI002583712A|nr:hypothetical protein [uncultured Prochlorococcus sp.]